ncbi:hypothetical protein EJB05_29593, partial [Eragrostis curvula]
MEKRRRSSDPETPPMEKRRRLSAEEIRARIQASWEASLLDDLRMEEKWRKEREDEEYYDAIARALVPASRKAMAGLYKPRWEETREEHGCAICLEDLQTRKRLRMMPCCGHTFHESCIITWLLMNRLCPICLSALPSEEEQRQLDEQEACERDKDAETDEPVNVVD